MYAAQVMTHDVIVVSPETSVRDAARCMLRNRISGLPVVDGSGRLVGMITEGDLLRRGEIGTERQRPRWLELFADPDKRADEYMHAFGRRVDEVMTKDVKAVAEATPLTDLVGLMERHRIKRVPVMREGELVGIVTRANLLPALAWSDGAAPATEPGDETVRAGRVREVRGLSGAPVPGVKAVKTCP